MNKDNIRTIFTILISALVSGLVSVAASGHLFDSNEVVYDNSQNDIQSSNVKGAVDELYAAATDYSTINTRLSNIENIVKDNSTSLIQYNGIEIGKNNTSSYNSYIDIYHNNATRSSLYFNQSLDMTMLTARNSSGTSGAGKLGIYGSSIDLGDSSSTIKIGGKPFGWTIKKTWYYPSGNYSGSPPSSLMNNTISIDSSITSANSIVVPLTTHWCTVSNISIDDTNHRIVFDLDILYQTSQARVTFLVIQLNN